MATDFAEQILQAAQIIAEKSFENIACDVTEICTIVDATDCKNGHYVVTNGTIRFDAYSASSDYKVKDMVRVSIMNGDYSQKKYIVGLHVTDDSSLPITYVSPLDTVLDMSDNIISSDMIHGLKANGSTQQICLWSTNLNDAHYRDLQNNSIYDTISLKGDFKTLLTDYNVNSGSYGLRLDMYVHPTNDNVNYVVHRAYLDSSDMYGNPYSFLAYSTQAIKFNIAELGTIDTISLYLYQNSDFTYLTDDKKLQVLPTIKDYDNILVKNLYLSFGSEIADIEDNTLKIYTNDSAVFDRDPVDESYNTKNISLLWYNKDSNGKYVGFSDGYYDPGYDEQDYLDKNVVDSRLAAHLGKDVPTDERGLRLAADLQDANLILKRLGHSITVDLRQNLLAFQSRIDSICAEEGDLKKAFDAILSTNVSNYGAIASTGLTLENNTKVQDEYYTKVLSMAKKRQDDGTIPSKDGLIPIGVNEIVKQPNELIVKVKELLKSTRTAIHDKYSGFTSIWDNYDARTQKIIGVIESLIQSFEALMENNLTESNQYFSPDYQFIPYKRVDFSDYENKYCIYWYRYEPGYYNEAETFMEREWRRLDAKNVGLPSAFIERDGLKYFAKKPDVDEGFLKVDLDDNAIVEKYSVVLFYNHQMFKSNVLEFTNNNPPDNNSGDKHGALYIEHSTDSQESYQSYGVNNCLINAADAYRTRYLKVRYEGLAGFDEQLIGGQVFWYIPKNSTMLSYSLDDYGVDFTHDDYDAVKSPMSMEGYICFYRKLIAKNSDETKLNEECALFPYRIKDYYSSSFSQNEIICKVITADKRTLEASIVFTFSSFGTSGTDYTLVVAPSGSKSAIDYNPNDVNKTHLSLTVQLYDYNNKPIEFQRDPTVDWEGPTPYIAMENNGQYALSIKPNAGPNEGYYYGVLKANTVFDIGDKENKRTVDLTTFYPVAYTSGNYYIEGASIVVYDSAGKSPTYYKDPFKIFNNSPGEMKDKEIKDVTWQIIYYNEKGKLLTDELMAGKDYKLLASYMPTIDSENKLVPCNMFLANTGGTHIYPVVVCYQNNVVLWAQPIHLMQNRYASAMLNSWDGKLTIDEKNGTILSTMVGAGRKTNNNTFEGVIMGNVGGKVNSDNATGIGLYGYHDGAQSFHFGVDGTAFIGKSSRGRINIDGNNGTISSASYEQNKNAGMLIDLDDGYIDIRGAMESGSNNVGKTYSPDGYSAHITLNALAGQSKPYFLISTPNYNKNSVWNNKPLIYIGRSEYYLQSENYEPGEYSLSDGVLNKPGKGMKIDLRGSAVDAYNLKITSNNIYLDATSGNHPYLVIKSNKGNNLFYAASNQYYLKTDDYKAGSSGTKIDLVNGKIDSYNFELTSGNIIRISSVSPYLKISDMLYMGSDAYYLQSHGRSSSSGIRLNLYTSADKPIIIGNKFSVAWDGTLNATNGNFSGSISGSSIYGGSINIGNGTFKVSSSGALTATSATIKGSISGSTISGGTITGSYISAGTISGTRITAGTFEVTSGGMLSATGAKLTTLTVKGALTVESDTSAKARLQVKGDTTIEGNLRINTSNIYLGGGKSERIYNESGWVCIESSGYVRIGYTAGVALGCNPVVGYKMTMPLASQTYIYTDGGGKTLAQYIEEQSGLIIGTGTAKAAQYLVSGGIKTLGAPRGQGAGGQILKTNGDGSTYWGTISYVNSAGSASRVYVHNGGDTPKTWIISCSAGEGSSTLYGTPASSITTGSSIRFKHTVKPILDNESSLLYQLQPKSYFYKPEMGYGLNQRYGFIAEEVELINSELVEYGDDGKPIGLYYYSILTLAVAEIQKLRKELDGLKSNLNIKD